MAFIQDLANFENALNDVIAEVHCTIKEIFVILEKIEPQKSHLRFS